MSKQELKRVIPEELKDYKVIVDVFVCFTPLCKIDCEHFSTFFDKHGHGNSQSCINHGGILDDLDASRFSDGKIPVGCPHFPQEVLKKNRRMLDFHQAYGTLCYKYTGRYEGCYQEIQEDA